MLTFETILRTINTGNGEPHYFGREYVPSPGYHGKRGNPEKVRRVWAHHGVLIPLPNVTRDAEGRILARVLSTGKLKPVVLIRL